MASSAELVDQIRRTAGPGQHTLDPAVRRRLATLTRALVRARPDSVEEFDRYLAVRRRRLAVPAGPVADAVRDRTVLVTGGSGCIGTALLHQLAALRPAKLISLGVTPPVNQLPAVRYTHADVRAPARIQEVFDRYRPDLVFHLAAQRDPGLAERRAAETIGTNLLGTATIVAAAERTGSQRLVYASTGKAVRPFTTDTYAGSKRMGEWLLADATAQGRLICSGVRFTHVVDNAILLHRLRRWGAAGDTVRLHDPDTMFYVQSAAESAQLLLTALLTPTDDRFRLSVIRDLNWPVNLLDVALGFMIRHGRLLPLYFSGPEPGYEAAAYPGLYDPTVAGDISPLINIIEAHHVEVAAAPAVDAFPVAHTIAPGVTAALPRLYEHCRAGDDAAARESFRRAAWELFRATAASTDPIVLRRIIGLTRRHRAGMSPEHRRIDDVYRQAAAPADPATAVSTPALAGTTPGRSR